MKRLLVFALVAVVALGFVGLSSAEWSTSDRVQGTVEMGVIDYCLTDPQVDYRLPSHKMMASVSEDGCVLSVVLPKATKGDCARVIF